MEAKNHYYYYLIHNHIMFLDVRFIAFSEVFLKNVNNSM